MGAWDDKMNLVVFEPLKYPEPWKLETYRKIGGYEAWEKILAEKTPRETIIDKGGAILFVEAPGEGIIGTGALKPDGGGAFELTKMGVLERVRGLKAGEFLLRALIDRARQMGVETLYLLTNSACAAAIHLYEKHGFRHDAGIMADHGARYQRCDVAMRYVG